MMKVACLTYLVKRPRLSVLYTLKMSGLMMASSGSTHVKQARLAVPATQRLVAIHYLREALTFPQPALNGTCESDFANTARFVLAAKPRTAPYTYTYTYTHTVYRIPHTVYRIP